MPRLLSAAAALLAAVTVFAALSTARPAARGATRVYPGTAWEADPAPSSPDAARRHEALAALLRQGDTSAMLVVIGGRVRFSYGVRICPEPVHWGGLSGCTYSEGVSWGFASSICATTLDTIGAEKLVPSTIL